MKTKTEQEILLNAVMRYVQASNQSSANAAQVVGLDAADPIEEGTIRDIVREIVDDDPSSTLGELTAHDLERLVTPSGTDRDRLLHVRWRVGEDPHANEFISPS